MLGRTEVSIPFDTSPKINDQLVREGKIRDKGSLASIPPLNSRGKSCKSRYLVQLIFINGCRKKGLRRSAFRHWESHYESRTVVRRLKRLPRLSIEYWRQNVHPDANRVHTF